LWPFSAMQKKRSTVIMIYRLKKNAEFRVVYRKGKSFSNNLLVLYIYKNKKDFNRLGIVVSKKVGKSVIRNRIKRLIKESFRLNCCDLKTGYDLIFIARNASNDKKFKYINNSVINLLKKAGLYNK
jgi:ribonuclease P protein component